MRRVCRMQKQLRETLLGSSTPKKRKGGVEAGGVAVAKVRGISTAFRIRFMQGDLPSQPTSTCVVVGVTGSEASARHGAQWDGVP